MPICKNNPERTYKGDEPSPKGLGYCASGEKEGKIMKGKDGYEWIKDGGKWVKHQNAEMLLDKKLYKWWQSLSTGGIIVIFKDGTHKLVRSSKVNTFAQNKEIGEKWVEYGKDPEVEAIIWSAMSVDVIQSFIAYIIKHETKDKIEKMLLLKDLPKYLLDNYKKYFKKMEFKTKKDYYFKGLY